MSREWILAFSPTNARRLDFSSHLSTAPNLDTIEPKMGADTDAVAAALFGKTRRNVLGLLFAEPEKSFYLRDLARRTHAGQGAVQRELHRLSQAGIIAREGIGRTITYRANPDSPVFEELRSLLAKTVGAAERLRLALSSLKDRTKVAFVYGSYAKETGLRPESDIDLMVIGDASFGEVVELTAAAQNKLGRDINPTVYTEAEFAQRVEDGHHFLVDVLNHPKLFLIGGPRELEQLAEVRMVDEAPSDLRGDPRAVGRRRS